MSINPLCLRTVLSQCTTSRRMRSLGSTSSSRLLSVVFKSWRKSNSCTIRTKTRTASNLPWRSTNSLNSTSLMLKVSTIRKMDSLLSEHATIAKNRPMTIFLISFVAWHTAVMRTFADGSSFRSRDSSTTDQVHATHNKYSSCSKRSAKWNTNRWTRIIQTGRKMEPISLSTSLNWSGVTKKQLLLG